MTLGKSNMYVAFLVDGNEIKLVSTRTRVATFDFSKIWTSRNLEEYLKDTCNYAANIHSQLNAKASIDAKRV